MRVSVKTYNVGQGLGVLVKDDGHAAIFDGGTVCRNPNGYEPVSDIAAELSKYEKLDLLVVSHQDKDHWNYILDLMWKMNPQADRNDWVKPINSDWGAYKISNSIVEYIYRNMSESSKHKWQVIGKGVLEDKVTLSTSGMRYFMDVTIEEWSFYISIAEKVEEFNVYLHIRTNRKNFIFSISNIKQIGEKLESILEEYIGQVHLLGEILAIIVSNIENTIFNFNPGIIEDLVSQAGKIRFGIKRSYFGGLDRGTAYCMFINQMKPFRRNEISSFQSGILSTDFTDERGQFPYEPEKYLLDGKKNLLGTKGSIYKNATSLITRFNLSSTSVLLFPGDATVHTFRRLKNSRLMKGAEIRIFFAPHHGSYDTNYGYNYIGQELSPQPLSALLETYPPDCIIISAYHEKFGHPSVFFVEMACDFCRLDTDMHSLGACDNNGVMRTYGTKETDKMVYSTEEVWGQFGLNCIPLTADEHGVARGEVNHVPQPPMERKLSEPERELPDQNCFISFPRIKKLSS